MRKYFIFMLTFVTILTFASCEYDPNRPMKGEDIHSGLTEGTYYASNGSGASEIKYLMHISGEHDAEEGAEVVLEVYSKDPITEIWKDSPSYIYSGIYKHFSRDWIMTGDDTSMTYHIDDFKFVSCTSPSPRYTAAEMSGRITVELDGRTAHKVDDSLYGNVYEPVEGTRINISPYNEYLKGVMIGKIGIWTKIVM